MPLYPVAELVTDGPYQGSDPTLINDVTQKLDASLNEATLLWRQLQHMLSKPNHFKTFDGFFIWGEDKYINKIEQKSQEVLVIMKHTKLAGLLHIALNTAFPLSTVTQSAWCSTGWASFAVWALNHQ